MRWSRICHRMDAISCFTEYLALALIMMSMTSLAAKNKHRSSDDRHGDSQLISSTTTTANTIAFTASGTDTTTLDTTAFTASQTGTSTVDTLAMSTTDNDTTYFTDAPTHTVSPLDCSNANRYDTGYDSSDSDEVFDGVGCVTEDVPLDYTNITTSCSADGNTSFANESDCVDPLQPDNGQVVISNTSYTLTAEVICDVGYVIEGDVNITCCASGNWSSTNYTCIPVDCGPWSAQTPGSELHATLTYSKNTEYNSIAMLSCDVGYHVTGSHGILSEAATCLENGDWSIPYFKACLPSVHANAPNCPSGRDGWGLNWSATSPGHTAAHPCTTGYSGTVTRRCTPTGRWLMAVNRCVRQAIEDISITIQSLQDTPTPASMLTTLESLSKVTTPSMDAVTMVTGGEIETVTNLLDILATISEKVKVTDEQAENFLMTTSNLVDKSVTASWQSISQPSDPNSQTKTAGASKILDIVSKYSNVLSNNLKGSSDQKTIEVPNLVLRVASIDAAEDKTGVTFPGKATINGIHSSVHLPHTSLAGSKTYSTVVYKSLSGILSSRVLHDRTSSNKTLSKQEINSEVVTVNLDNWKAAAEFKINITMKIMKTDLRNPNCLFWDESKLGWNGTGCTLVFSNSTTYTCECNHLTNFAILMSPWTQNNVDTVALDVITYLGCSLSLLALILTITTHVVLWRYVKSDRAVILINLSVALIVSYIVFLAGVDRTENKDACTAISVVLQYIYLVVFFLMLVEGIEIAWTMLYVFTTRSRIRWLLPLAWVLPAVVVGISVGATQLEGYGNSQFCWLSVEGGLVWAFVGPALFIILINGILLILVMRAMFGTKSLSLKSRSERAKSGIRCLCILLPLMGCSWVIGVLYVNEDMAWVQYVFALCNTLQGLVIFLFHCVFNQQIGNALKRRKKKLADSSFISTKSSRSTGLSFPKSAKVPSGRNTSFANKTVYSCQSKSSSEDKIPVHNAGNGRSSMPLKYNDGLLKRI